MATFNEKFPRSVTLLEQRNRYFSRRGRSSDAMRTVMLLLIRPRTFCWNWKSWTTTGEDRNCWWIMKSRSWMMNLWTLRRNE